MSERPSRSAGRVSDDRGRGARCGEPPARWTGSSRFATRNAHHSGRAGRSIGRNSLRSAQNPAPKGETPQEPVPVPRRLKHKRKRHPRTAPADPQKESAPANAPRDGQPNSTAASSGALSVRYRFNETYSQTADPTRPELITQYRVGTRETTKHSRDNAQGATTRTETSRQTIYTERTAKVSRLAGEIVMVRRYDAVRIKDLVPGKPLTPSLLEGLTIWYHRKPGKKPLILNLTPDHPLREREFSFITADVFLPQLQALIPLTPQRISDTWPITRKMAQMVWAELPDDGNIELKGTLIGVSPAIELSKAASQTALSAVIEISGTVDILAGPTAFNARLYFTFEPKPAVLPSPSSPSPAGLGSRAAKLNEEVVDARGQITYAAMAQRLENPLSETDDRLKESLTVEVVLERRPFVAAPINPADPVELPLSLFPNHRQPPTRPTPGWSTTTRWGGSNSATHRNSSWGPTASLIPTRSTWSTSAPTSAGTCSSSGWHRKSKVRKKTGISATRRICGADSKRIR